MSLEDKRQHEENRQRKPKDQGEKAEQASKPAGERWLPAPTFCPVQPSHCEGNCNQAEV